MNQTAWDRVVAQATRHHAQFPIFPLDDYLKFVRVRGASYIAWAAGQSVARINLTRRRLRGTRYACERRLRLG